MVSRLVLVRHAKTQARNPELIDKDRQLTRAGRYSIEARFPISLQLLADEDAAEVKVWSSPALRAMQTAEVVAHALGVDGIEVRDSLYANSVDAFMAELVEEQGTVIAVGHNPFMDELYARLSGAPQGMGTGAMASFGFAATDDPASVGSWLEWFVQGPRVVLWQSIVDVEDALSDAAARIARCSVKLLENPDDPESLHQYRISLRIARSLLGFLAPYCKGAALRKTMRDIKKLQDPTSRLRELDMPLRGARPGSRSRQASWSMPARSFARDLSSALPPSPRKRQLRVWSGASRTCPGAVASGSPVSMRRSSSGAFRRCEPITSCRWHTLAMTTKRPFMTCASWPRRCAT